MDSAQTIIAVSSPPGRSPRGLIRLSGSDALKVARHLASPVTGRSTAPLPPGGVGGGDAQTSQGSVDLGAHGSCRPPHPASPGEGGAIRQPLHERTLLPVRLKSPPIPALLAYFPSPHSYTGEEVVELQMPGNPALLDRLLHQAVAAGARLAQPGEFTFRAFTADKMDLTQAEGIAATIAAVSDGQLRAAAMLREGKLGSWSVEVVESLGTQLALVEAGIDFVDQEDVTPIAPGELDRNLERIEHKLSTLMCRSRSWGALEALPRVVLAGPPSSGKSTLFNALLGRRRAVVHAMPGTTRDVLAEPLELVDARGRRMEAMLVDVAGVEEARTAAGEWGIDVQAQAAARKAVEQADLVLRVIAPFEGAEVGGTPNVRRGVAGAKARRAPASFGETGARRLSPSHPVDVHVHTKADLYAWPADVLSVSAVTGEGLEALRTAIAQRLGDRAVSVTSQAMALQPRHEAALRAAGDALRQARQLLAPQHEAHALDNMELIADCLRTALDELAGLGGRLTPDDVIGRVFATFCVGK